jgi:hypothetical protein
MSCWLAGRTIPNLCMSECCTLTTINPGTLRPAQKERLKRRVQPIRQLPQAGDEKRAIAQGVDEHAHRELGPRIRRDRLHLPLRRPR